MLPGQAELCGGRSGSWLEQTCWPREPGQRPRLWERSAHTEPRTGVAGEDGPARGTPPAHPAASACGPRPPAGLRAAGTPCASPPGGRPLSPRFPVRHLPDPQLLRQDAGGPVRGPRRPRLPDHAGRVHLLQGTVTHGSPDLAVGDGECEPRSGKRSRSGGRQ